MFYLVRHGETEYKEKDTKIYQGFGVNFASLSAKGRHTIENTAKDARLCGANIILSSPYTRALQTAAILSKELQVDIIIETDLHEWLANKHYRYETDEQAERNYEEFVQYGGMYPDGEEKNWEDTERLRQRLFGVLDKYKHYDKVIVVCHGMLIQAVCNGYHPRNGEIIEWE